MKNKCNVPLVRLFGFIALAAVIGFSMAACDNDTTEPNLSLNGVWMRDGNGLLINISGSTATWISFGSDTLWQDAGNRGYTSIGGQEWRNLTKTGNLTWSGQELLHWYNTSNPNVCIGVTWNDFEITMSADGNSISTYYGATRSAIWRRQ